MKHIKAYTSACDVRKDEFKVVPSWKDFSFFQCLSIHHSKGKLHHWFIYSILHFSAAQLFPFLPNFFPSPDGEQKRNFSATSTHTHQLSLRRLSGFKENTEQWFFSLSLPWLQAPPFLKGKATFSSHFFHTNPLWKEVKSSQLLIRKEFFRVRYHFSFNLIFLFLLSSYVYDDKKAFIVERDINNKR